MPKITREYLEKMQENKSELVDKVGTDFVDLSDDEILEQEIKVDKSDKSETLDLDKNRKVSVAEMERTEKSFQKQVKAINETLKELTEEEQKIYKEEALKNLGIPEEVGMKLFASEDFAWQNSDIFKTLAIYVIQQEVKNQTIIYESQIEGLVPTVEFENGVVQKIYKDYFEADETPAWKNVEISDYNQGTNLTTYEVYRAKKNIKKGYDLYDSRLNDFGKSTAVFLATMHDIKMNVARPMAKIIYRYKLQAIVAPFENQEFNGIDLTGKPVDITIKASSVVDFIRQFNTLLGNGGTLYSPSRDREEQAGWTPTGFTNPLELQFSKEDTTVLIDTTIYNQLITNDELLKTYNLELLGLPQFKTFNYKQFAEYGKITGLTQTATSFRLFAIMKGQNGENPVEIIKQYDITKRVETPVAKSVVVSYTRVGKAIDKNARLLSIQVDITAPTN